MPTNGLPRPRTAGKTAPMYPAGTMGTQPDRLGHLIGLPKPVNCSRVVMFNVYTLLDAGDDRRPYFPLVRVLLAAAEAT